MEKSMNRHKRPLFMALALAVALGFGCAWLMWQKPTPVHESDEASNMVATAAEQWPEAPRSDRGLAAAVEHQAVLPSQESLDRRDRQGVDPEAVASRAPDTRPGISSGGSEPLWAESSAKPEAGTPENESATTFSATEIHPSDDGTQRAIAPGIRRAAPDASGSMPAVDSQTTDEPVSVPLPVAREALSAVGSDRDAEQVWISAINDPDLPEDDRRNLIEDLNEDGFSDPKNITSEDLPLIESRMDLIEELLPTAMDEVNAAAMLEAYKDLAEMHSRLTKR
jgi:hypothetical protein